MATVRRTVEEARQEAADQVDFAKLDATTEEDIRRYMEEDGFDPDAPFAGLVPKGRVSPLAVRKRSGLSQDKFATAIGVPVKTFRNWEQGVTVPDPAAQSLLALVNDDPDRAFRVLSDARKDHQGSSLELDRLADRRGQR